MIGAPVFDKMMAKTAAASERFAETHGRRPRLAILLAGDDRGSKVYVRKKQEACGLASIDCTVSFVADPTDEALAAIIDAWNEDEGIDGIIVQLPLPLGVDRLRAINAVDPLKDVDGFHAENLGLLAQGCPRFCPATPLGVLAMLDHYGVPLRGTDVAVINSGIVVGLPLAHMLTQRGATVTLCHEHTGRISEVTRRSQVIVTAVGKRPAFSLTRDMVSPGSVVIDVGFNRVDGRVCGDADDLSGIASLQSPVPNGIGPCTIACLLDNTIKAANVTVL